MSLIIPCPTLVLEGGDYVRCPICGLLSWHRASGLCTTPGCANGVPRAAAGEVAV